jgi:hypothetical protein
MLVALLLVLGVNLIVIVGFVAVVVGRRRWLKRQPGEFIGAIRVSGEVDGLAARWKRGSARWVRDVLVWDKGPFMFRTVLVPVDRLTQVREAKAHEVKRLGDTPVVIVFLSGDATIEVAATSGHRDLVVGPFTASPESPTTTPARVDS